MQEKYIVKGEEKDHILNDNYTKFEKEVAPEELIEMIKSPKIIVYEALRKLITD